MRESIGGSWLFGIVALFIALFSGFLAYSISYTKAFKVKNEIVTLIEKNEGYSKSENDVKNMSDTQLKNDTSVEAKAFNIIKSYGYNYETAETVDCGKSNSSSMKTGGYCLAITSCEETGSGNNKHVKYVTYKVTTYIALEIPVIGITVKLPIEGETKTIYNPNSSYINSCPKN